MKTVINLGKTIGRDDDPVVSNDTNEVKPAGQKAFPALFVPKGVFRFNTHEEADEWMEKMLARRRE